MFQKEYGLGDLFCNIVRPIVRPILKEAKGIGMAVGTDLAQNLRNDLIAGKSTKGSVKARGKEVKGLAAQRTLQALLRRQQSGNGSFTRKQPPTESNFGMSGKTAKRKRSQSKSQPPAKRKRPQSKSQPPKRRRVQKGGMGFILDLIRKGRGERKETKKRTGKRKPKNKQGRNVNLGNKQEVVGRGKNVDPENKREGNGPERNVSPGGGLERNVNG